MALIKCLDYECKEKINDNFIINLLNSNEILISKYIKYKLELEVINDPNKKLCPYPNCDSYLELKDIKNKDVECENKHSYCFLCLQKPHGNLPCNQEIDKDLKEFAKIHFIKKCPNCKIITEKAFGCNHMTCSKCLYQWCWLCNEKYENDHFNKGKCRGKQYFRPNNEYEINLAFEGKIDISQSQIQEMDDDIIPDFRGDIIIQEIPINIEHHIRHNRRERFVMELPDENSNRSNEQISLRIERINRRHALCKNYLSFILILFFGFFLESYILEKIYIINIIEITFIM